MIATWLLLACAPAPTSWITDAGPVSAGVVSDEDGALVYVCGNTDATRDSHSRWFQARWVGDGFQVSTDGWTLDAQQDGDVLEMVLTGPEGEAADWLAEPQETALYANEETCLDGAIATEGRVDGSWCAPDGTRFQVEPVETIVLGDTLDLDTPDGPRTFVHHTP